jgi:hypothetical protein
VASLRLAERFFALHSHDVLDLPQFKEALAARICFMTTSLLSPKSSTIAARVEPTEALGTQVGRWACLIVSAKQDHQNVFCQAAIARGWETFVTADPHEALKFMCRNSIKLALIDFHDVTEQAGAAGFDNFRSLAEYIKWVGGVLLIINGPVHDSQTQDSSVELWARQLGSWSYLPGILPQSDLSDLCEQALQVVEKLHHPKR